MATKSRLKRLAFVILPPKELSPEAEQLLQLAKDEARATAFPMTAAEREFVERAKIYLQRKYNVRLTEVPSGG